MIKSKKSVHINVDPDDHAAFKVQCVKRGLSMQEVFAYFVSRIAIESNDMTRYLDQIVVEKEKKSVKKYAQTDIEAIFSILEEQDPLK